MDHQVARKNNVTWFDGYISRQDREELHGHRGAVIWFTGLSASGKSTIAHLVEKELHRRGCSTYVLDGDNVRPQIGNSQFEIQNASKEMVTHKKRGTSRIEI